MHIIKLIAKQLNFLRELDKTKHVHLFAKYPSIRTWLKFTHVSQKTFDVSWMSHHL